MKDAIIGSDGTVIKEAIRLNYGNFIQSTVNFLVTALSIFIIIKILNKNKASTEELLLTEIRDI